MTSPLFKEHFILKKKCSGRFAYFLKYQLICRQVGKTYTERGGKGEFTQRDVDSRGNCAMSIFPRMFKRGSA